MGWGETPSRRRVCSGRRAACKIVDCDRHGRHYSSHVEAKQDHVAIAHDILFSFNTKLARFARFREGTERNEIVMLNRVRRDEAAL